jgi:tRNA nucleotidyltransferase (CCA-adding enzyme)
MQVYLVGGAVRDKLLGLSVYEKDWLVVGATSTQLLDQGYQQVGKDFPVFLHPETHEEYALARTERKTAPGYSGFSFYAEPEVTIEEDLQRRDLTINAIAQDDLGRLIDPYNGQADITHKVLRHVSPAFAEDPVRILRLARFSARFAHLGFNVAQDTVKLMQDMVASGEVNALVPERVWQEWHKALGEKDPAMFFQVLQECGALDVLLPEVAAQYQAVIQNIVLASKHNDEQKIRFAASMMPLSIESLKKICRCYVVPTEFKQLAVQAARAKDSFASLSCAEEFFQLLEQLDAFRRPQRLLNFKILMQALNFAPKQVSKLEQAFRAAKLINAKEFAEQGLRGEEIGKALREARVKVIRAL